MGKMDIQGLHLASQILASRDFVVKNILVNSIPFEQVGLKGETMNLISPNSISSVDWTKGSLSAQKDQPLAWHKVNPPQRIHKKVSKR